MKTRYSKISQYQSLVDSLIDRGMDFDTISTNYSRKVITDHYSVMFNDSGRSNNKLLKLISAVRNDGEEYLNSGRIIRDTPIFWYDLVRKPSDSIVIHKIDIKSAYWEAAKKLGVISQKTDDKFKELYGECRYDIAKIQRLKALGCLATTRRKEFYIGGIKDPKQTLIETEKTKDVYIEVCRTVDYMMRDCATQIPGCQYYYWDCMFTDASHSAEVVDFFKELKYNVTVEETKIFYQEVGGKGMICSVSDGKAYSVRKESRHLIDEISNFSMKNEIIYRDDRNLKQELCPWM